MSSLAAARRASCARRRGTGAGCHVSRTDTCLASSRNVESCKQSAEDTRTAEENAPTFLNKTQQERYKYQIIAEGECQWANRLSRGAAECRMRNRNVTRAEFLWSFNIRHNQHEADQAQTKRSPYRPPRCSPICHHWHHRFPWV